MTVIAPPTPHAGREPIPGAEDGVQRFVFEGTDWAFYRSVRSQLADRRVFVTYHKGRLELVTISMLHERVTGLLSAMVRALAEETDTPLIGSGSVTLQREDLDVAAEADSSFYVANVHRVRGKKVLDLSVDPPPDLGIEVEITRRLGERKSIYRDLGVPELWVHGSGALAILVRRGADYEPVDRSPTFPQLSPQEIYDVVAAGLTADETAWIKSFRKRVREATRPGDAPA